MKTAPKPLHFKLRLILCVFVIASCLLALHTAAFADDSGFCGADGDNLSWRFEKNALYITGKGPMADYSAATPSPWQGKEIKMVHLSDGVSSVGNQAFYNCGSLEAVFYPDGLKQIGNRAFYNCRRLAALKLPEGGNPPSWK